MRLLNLVRVLQRMSRIYQQNTVAFAFMTIFFAATEKRRAQRFERNMLDSAIESSSGHFGKGCASINVFVFANGNRNIYMRRYWETYRYPLK